MKEIKLGMEVRNKITGYKGIVTSKLEFLNGCIQFGVKAKSTGGKEGDCEYIDYKYLEVIGKGVSIRSEDTGGDMSDCPK